VIVSKPFQIKEKRVQKRERGVRELTIRAKPTHTSGIKAKQPRDDPKLGYQNLFMGGRRQNERVAKSEAAQFSNIALGSL
jgi:hypothetical protein